MNEYLHMSPNFGKHKIIPILLFLPILAFILVFASSQQQLKSAQNTAIASVKSENVSNTVLINGLSIPVEISDTETKRQNGLSNRPPLEEGYGMLFVFPTQNIQPIFWMKDMYFDIDIIWINDGKVAQIHNDVSKPTDGTPDNQLQRYSPNMLVDYVLEMNAGSAEQYGIEVGDNVILPTL